jgi:hypothetical protein
MADRPRDAAGGVLPAVVRDHLEESMPAARPHGDGSGVPAFVGREPPAFLTCGVGPSAASVD